MTAYNLNLPNNWQWFYTVIDEAEDLDLHYTSISLDYGVNTTRPSLVTEQELKKETANKLKKYILSQHKGI